MLKNKCFVNEDMNALKQMFCSRAHECFKTNALLTNIECYIRNKILPLPVYLSAEPGKPEPGCHAVTSSTV